MIDPNLKEERRLVWIDGASISEVIRIITEEAEGLKNPTLEVTEYGDGGCDIHVCGYVNKTEYELKKAIEEATKAQS